MERINKFVARRGRWIFVFWLLIFLAGGAAAPMVQDRLSFDFSLPGQEGYETEAKLLESYGTIAIPSYIPTLTAPAGEQISDNRKEVAAVADSLRKIPGLRVLDYSSTNDEKFLTSDGRSTFILVFSPPVPGFIDPQGPVIDKTVEDTAKAQGLTSGMTGYQQLAAGSAESEGPSVLVETLVGGLGALVVLVFVFASFLALVPLIIAAVSILSTFLIVLGLTTFTDVSFIVNFLISLVGLGVAIDYSLLVVSRWREERALGASNDEAVDIAMRTAGHAVFASGVTVAISLVALILVPVPLLRSMGIGGMLIPVMSVLVVLTLLPAMLRSIGPKVDWPRVRHEEKASTGWTAWARGVVRLRWIAATVALVALGVAIAPAFSLQIGQANSASLASNGPAVDSLKVLRDGGIGSGLLTTVSILTDGGDPQAIAAAASAVPGVRTAVASSPGRDGKVVIDVIPDAETVDSNSVKTVTKIRKAVQDQPGVIGVTGVGATVLDYIEAVYKTFPLVLALIALVTYILLVRTFRSLLLPLKAVLLNLFSVAAVFGISTWFWQQGNGSEAIFGISETGAVTFWIPILIFAFLFGLSMDYEVFILARMREEYDVTGSTTQAVVTGLGRTGRLVTSAALILFFSFAALASAPGTDVKVFATALGVGVLLDATIVRALLVPSLVSLFGKWNWWLPVWAAKLVRVEPSPLIWVPPTPAKESLASSSSAG